jgi:hypothetical protein
MPRGSGPHEDSSVLTSAAQMNRARNQAANIVVVKRQRRVERDRHICDLATLFLKRVGFDVERAGPDASGSKGATSRARDCHHRILPGVDGLALCR